MWCRLLTYCSDDMENWNNGTAAFWDPIPASMGYAMLDFTATIYMSACENVSLALLLGGLCYFRVIGYNCK